MKIFVALTLLVIATITAKDLRIDSQPGLGFPGSGMAYDCFFGHWLDFHLTLLNNTRFSTLF